MERPLIPKTRPRVRVPALPDSWILRQRVHDYAFLIKRWNRLARATGMTGEVFARAGEHEVLCYKTKALRHSGGIYISAGIHGDEPAATEALITWAEQN